MPRTPELELHESDSRIRLEGEVTVTRAVEVKKLLLEWLASGRNLRLDLENATEIDITLLQLLVAAAREAERAGLRMITSVSPAAAAAAGDAGFEQFPGAARGK